MQICIRCKKALYRNSKNTKAEFTKLFRTYGIPKQMHTDNGSPFGSVRAIQRFTQLSYWFIELGIVPIISNPRHPNKMEDMKECTVI